MGDRGTEVVYMRMRLRQKILIPYLSMFFVLRSASAGFVERGSRCGTG